MSLDETTSTGPSDPDVPAPSGSEAADPIRHVGGPWFEVDTDAGPERVRGREAAERLASDTPVSPEPEIASERVDRFRGPAEAFALSAFPDADVIAEGPRGPVDVTVDGTTVTRTSGLFGRGYWTFTYTPA